MPGALVLQKQLSEKRKLHFKNEKIWCLDFFVVV
jgi:hypothetical protein